MWESPITQDEVEAIEQDLVAKEKKIEDLETIVTLLQQRLADDPEEERMSISSRLLILYYSGALGLLANLDREQTATFIKPIVGANGLTNLKKYLSSLGNPKLTKSDPPFTITDLKRVYDHFEKAGHIEGCKRIHADVEILSKNLKGE